MFGIDSSELAVIALVALLVIGPKDLPRAMRWVGQWVAKARAMSRHLRTGFDTMMREAELEEMQKVWAAQNEAIMKATALDNPLPASPTEDGWDPPAAEPPMLAGSTLPEPTPPEPTPPEPTPAEPTPREPVAPAEPAAAPPVGHAGPAQRSVPLPPADAA